MTVAIFVYLQVRLNITGNASQKNPEKFARRSSAFMMVLLLMISGPVQLTIALIILLGIYQHQRLGLLGIPSRAVWSS
ncbi:hypothetical protein C4Y93_000050 [Klebsiella pneumoniae subsp. pneumoniae]|nr:hypothetical protein C4Y93_000050 [Klebsiella pneumoniae subsp. pneumoniae]